MSTSPLKVVSLTSENIKRLTAVHIKPDGNIVEITGNNGNGKSSVLDSIWWALEGTSHIQAEPIRHGAAMARIVLDLGEIIVKRTFRNKEEGGYTTSVTVESADGMSFRSPQSLLDGLIGALAMDPLEFSRMKPKEQFDALAKHVTGFDFAAFQLRHDQLYDKRTTVNRQVKEKLAAANNIVIVDESPGKRVDEDALVQQIQTAGDTNLDIEQRRTRRGEVARKAQELRSDILVKQGRIAELQSEIAALNAGIESASATADELEQKLANAEPLPPLVDATDLNEQLKQARESNKAIDEWERNWESKKALLAEYSELSTQADNLTASITDLVQSKQDAIAKAHLPVNGLGFGDGFITLNGLPFEQASDAERLRASVAIAMADNPRLRVIRIREGSLLDPISMQLVAQLADQHDMQVWVETVASGRASAIVIEDGHVKGDEVHNEAPPKNKRATPARANA